MYVSQTQMQQWISSPDPVLPHSVDTPHAGDGGESWKSKKLKNVKHRQKNLSAMRKEKEQVDLEHLTEFGELRNWASEWRA